VVSRHAIAMTCLAGLRDGICPVTELPKPFEAPLLLITFFILTPSFYLVVPRVVFARCSDFHSVNKKKAAVGAASPGCYPVPSHHRLNIGQFCPWFPFPLSEPFERFSSLIARIRCFALALQNTAVLPWPVRHPH